MWSSFAAMMKSFSCKPLIFFVCRDGHVAPAEADVGVMPLGFRKIGHLPDEAERLGEVPELERSLNPPRLVLNTPFGRLTLMSADFVRRKGWNAASTRSAGFRREG
jgi:hypothetical protein